jgi:hypothetical protein
VRSGTRPEFGPERNIRGFKKRAPRNDDTDLETPDEGRKRAAR